MAAGGKKDSTSASNSNKNNNTSVVSNVPLSARLDEQLNSTDITVTAPTPSPDKNDKSTDRKPHKTKQQEQLQKHTHKSSPLSKHDAAIIDNNALTYPSPIVNNNGTTKQDDMNVLTYPSPLVNGKQNNVHLTVTSANNPSITQTVQSPALSQSSGKRKHLTRRKDIVKEATVTQNSAASKLSAAQLQEKQLPIKFKRMMDTSGRCQSVWLVVARVLTFWIPDKVVEKLICKTTDASVTQAWREKLALCLISILSCVFLGFFTFYYQSTSCPSQVGNQFTLKDLKAMNTPGLLLIRGEAYDAAAYLKSEHLQIQEGDPTNSRYASNTNVLDVSALFPPDLSKCREIFPQVQQLKCQLTGSDITKCHSSTALNGWKKMIKGQVYYEWSSVIGSKRYAVYNGKVLDFEPYTAQQHQSWMQRPDVDEMIQNAKGKDASLLFAQSQQTALADCLSDLYYAGMIDDTTVVCLAANTILNITLVVILGLVMTRFVLALAFSWFLSKQLGEIEQRKSMFKRRTSVASMNAVERAVTAATHPQSFSLFHRVDFTHQYKDLYTMCLVTCYSEGEDGLRTTLDSLAMTDYNSNYKMIFVVADGVVQGSGNSKPTGEIILDMMTLDPAIHGQPTKTTDEKGRQVTKCEYAEPQSYVAVGGGSKRHNMAKVYCGTYKCEDRSVAMILVYKCGCPDEANSAKPGNRGKRDSQILLMDFLSKVMFDEPQTPFQFDLFTKWTHIMTVQNGGRKRVTPDLFEIVLMVDADTKVMPPALTRMVAVMQRDPTVMGLCGETRIMNKSETWVTMIQVFEYYISHHLAKGFESIFGGVTCLPGCFCMYRIKAPKPIEPPEARQLVQNPEKECLWVPVLTNPDILADYSVSETDTLHKKNLLLLGEDRYLSTLMLRKFPHRKMMFVPRALCKTTVPAEFKVLLSQRRRWINSTIHNLMELVLVQELCGTFCFSMQFVVFLELVGTITLPAAICFTMVLVMSAALSKSVADVPWVPIGLLFAILGLPGILIFLTTRKMIYISYLFVYLLALPIWNFVLPSYAFWHFDDFSWGQTRQVAGEKKGGDSHGHGDGKTGDADPLAGITMKHWIYYELERKQALLAANKSDPIGYVQNSEIKSSAQIAEKQTADNFAMEKSSSLAREKKKKMVLSMRASRVAASGESTSFEPAPSSAQLTPRVAGGKDDD